MRKIKSFVRRNGRLSSSQKHALEKKEYLVKKLPKLQGIVGLEIGFGMGDSLLETAMKEKNKQWLGIEVYERGVASVIRQAKEKALDNIVLRIGDVVEIIEEEIQSDTIDHVRIFFPDPWPKKRHHKRRLINKEFLQKLDRILKPTGVIHIATDNANYAEACQEIVEELPNFVISDQILERPLTKFAKKAMEKNVGITDIVIVKQT